MRIELPEGYVPPQPTHPHYGYLTPEEQAEQEAVEHEGVEGPEGIVPTVDPEAGMPPAAPSPRAPEPEVPEPEPEVVEPVVAEPVVVEPEAPDEATRPRPTGWVPQAPPEPSPTPASEQASPGEPRWDAYRQEWVTAPAPAAEAAEEPPCATPAAAGGRASSSSWTSADGQRYRWDARAEQWVAEGPDPT